MIANGTYEWIKGGERKRCHATFESTGIKDELTGKVLWRKFSKEGRPQNIFAEQFRPEVPWAVGRWFVKMNGGVILEMYPQLKVETERSKSMTDAEYIQYLKDTYEC